MTNAVSMRWASMRQTSQESKGSSSTHFRPLKKNHKDSQAHYLEDDHKAIKYLWWHLVQNNCFRFKTSPGELPKSSSNFRYCSDIPSRIDGTLTALMQGADFISEGPTVSQTAHSAFKCKTSDLCWATQQKPFGFSMSSFGWQEKSFSLPFSLPAPVPQFRDLSEQKRQPAAKPWPNQLPAVRFLTGERAALPEQGKHPGLGKRRHWGDSTGWGGAETSPDFSLHRDCPAHLAAEWHFVTLIPLKKQRGTRVPAAEFSKSSPGALPRFLHKWDRANAI